MSKPAFFRYSALDSLRGVCACLVALFHLKSTGLITHTELVRNAWMFVDFFFVLSGFVISASYRDRLRAGYPIRHFMWLRLGRVYPLHFAILVVYVLFETAKLHLGNFGVTLIPPFTSPRNPEQLAHSVALVQIFGLSDVLSWNGPSWSIAAEVWTYLLAALLLALSGRRLYPIVAAVALACFAVLAFDGGPHLERTFSMALLRCVYGFGAGMLTYRLFELVGERARLSGAAASIAELAMVGFVLAFVIFAGSGFTTMFAPLVFMGAVFLFALEGGVVSRLLRTGPMLFLGTISYSIYMVHAFVEGRLVDVALLVKRFTGWPVAEVGRDASGPAKFLGQQGHALLADLLVVGALLAIILTAWISYRLVEAPVRDWSRRKLRERIGALPPKTPVAF